MNRITSFAIATTILSITMYGCGSSTPPNDASSEESAATHEEMGHGDHESMDHEHHSDAEQSDMEKMKAELAKLSPEDAASAEKQHFCPVSDSMLGTMGAPIKMDVKGHQVWICCNGCKDALLENPDKYLAKLQHE